MLNPDAFSPSPKKKAVQRRLIKSSNRPSPQQVAHDNAVNDKIISDSIKRQTAPPPNKPAYKPPTSPPLSTKTGPHNVFNPKAKINSSQIIDRTPSNNDIREKFVAREKFSIASRKGRTNAQMEKLFPTYINEKAIKKIPPNMGLHLKGTKNKEALLKRLREK